MLLGGIGSFSYSFDYNMGTIRVKRNEPIMDEKKIYYIEIASGMITQSAVDSTWNFKIEATDEEIRKLREYFDRAASSEVGNFIRAHIPFREYHDDPDNDIYDENMKSIYQLIHQLGDSEAKQHIESIGLLDQI